MAKRIHEATNAPKRQIRYWIQSETDPETHIWNVLVINEPRRIRGILQKLYEAVQPLENIVKRTEGKVEGTQMRYQLVSFTSYGQIPSDEKWTKIYNGKVRRDPTLATRQSPDRLARYVDAQIARGRLA